MNEYINIVLHSQQKNVIDLFKTFCILWRSYWAYLSKMTRERKEQIQATILVNTVHCIIYCYDYGSRQYGNMVNVTPIFLVQGKILTLILLVLKFERHLLQLYM